MRLVDELLAPTLELRRLVRGRIADDQADLLAASREQGFVLNRTRSRRLEVVGPAGSGKSMLAAEKARRLAREGTLGLLGHPPEGRRVSGLVDEPSDIGGQGRELVRVREPEQGGLLG